MDSFERFSGEPRRRIARRVIEMLLDGERVRLAIGRKNLGGIEAEVRRKSRKRPPGMAPALVEPPRGPLPLAGGAAAPLEFDA